MAFPAELLQHGGWRVAGWFAHRWRGTFFAVFVVLAAIAPGVATDVAEFGWDQMVGRAQSRAERRLHRRLEQLKYMVPQAPDPTPGRIEQI